MPLLLQPLHHYICCGYVMELLSRGRCDNSNFNTFKSGIHMVSPLKFISNLPNRGKHILIKFGLSWASMKIIFEFPKKYVFKFWCQEWKNQSHCALAPLVDVCHLPSLLSNLAMLF